FLNPQPGKCFHAKRQKRLADVETRKLVSFEQDHASPCFAEQSRCGAAGGAAADDRNIIIFHREKVADFTAKQSERADFRSRFHPSRGSAGCGPVIPSEVEGSRRETFKVN